MSENSSNFESTRKLLDAFVQVLQEFPEALKGSGAKIASASEENQPLSSSEISGINSRLRDDEDSIVKLEEKLKIKRAERDADLLAKVGNLRATREWLQFNYPDKSHPVRKLFEELNG